MKHLRTLWCLLALLSLSIPSVVFAEESSVAPVVTETKNDLNDGKPAWASNWRSQPEPVAKSGSTMLLGLSGCIALFAIGIWAAKRFGLIKPVGKLSGMRVVERTALSGKTSLCLIEARGKQFLVAVGSERVSLISNLSVGDSLDNEQSFEDLLCEKPQPISAC